MSLKFYTLGDDNPEEVVTKQHRGASVGELRRLQMKTRERPHLFSLFGCTE